MKEASVNFCQPNLSISRRWNNSYMGYVWGDDDLTAGAHQALTFLYAILYGACVLHGYVRGDCRQNSIQWFVSCFELHSWLLDDRLIRYTYKTWQDLRAILYLLKYSLIDHWTKSTQLRIDKLTSFIFILFFVNSSIFPLFKLDLFSV